MPYTTTDDLPDTVKNVLPDHAQEIYKEAFNSAYEQYADPEARRGDDEQEETAHKVAWSAVKKAGYKRGDDDFWHRPAIT